MAVNDLAEALKSMSIELSDTVQRCRKASEKSKDAYAKAYLEGEANAYLVMKIQVERALRGLNRERSQ